MGNLAIFMIIFCILMASIIWAIRSEDHGTGKKGSS